MMHSHRFGIWAAAFLYWGFLGSRRQCLDCAHLERACLGGYRDDRKERLAAYLTARLAR
jgi:hypothetical protein